VCISVEKYKSKHSKSMVKNQHVQRKADHNGSICLLRLALGYVLCRLKRNEEVKTDLHVI